MKLRLTLPKELKLAIPNNINLTEICAWLCVVFSGFYLYGTPIISPVYISFFTVLAVVIFGLFTGDKCSFNKVYISALMPIVYIGITQPLLFHLEVLGQCIAFAYFILTVYLLNNFDNRKIVKISEHFLCFSTILFAIDTYLRVHSALHGANLISSFYAFKGGSIMWNDTNGLGLQVVVMFFLALYLDIIQPKKSYKVYQLILFIVTILSFSRMSIVAIVVFWIIFKQARKLFSLKNIILMLSFGLAFLLLQNCFTSLNLFEGRSLDSKFYVISKTIDYIKNADLSSILFGVGLANTKSVLGYWPGHNYFSMYFVGSGLIGFLVVSSLLFYISIKTRFKALIIILPILFNGFSVYIMYNAFFFSSLAIIYLIERNLSQKNENLYLEPVLLKPSCCHAELVSASVQLLDSETSSG
ncbi:MAG: hypothetical protein WCG23_12125 [bacterium]